MIIDWLRYSPRITLSGRSSGQPGIRTGLRWRESIVDHDLWFATSGTGDFKGKNGAIIPIGYATCLWLTPGHVYEIIEDTKDPVVNYYVHFELVDADGKVRPYDEPTPPERLDNADSLLIDPIMRRIFDLISFYYRGISPKFPPEHLQIAESLLRGLLINLDYTSESQADPGHGSRRRRRELVMRSIARMQECQGRAVTVENLAEEAGYSPEHFSRIFREIIGQSPVDYLIRVRMQQARKILADTSLSIEDISHMLGYRHQAFFSSQFKRRTGLTPRDYRRRYASGEQGGI